MKRLKLWLFRRYYNRHPDKFCEKYLGVTLYQYQKEFIKKCWKHKGE